MSRSYTTKSPGLPIGEYVCEFVDAEETTHAEYGDGLRWIFEAIEGPEEGRRTMRTTSEEPTPKNKCGKFMAMLVGATPQDGQEVTPDDHIGEKYKVLVGWNDDMSATRVESFSPLDKSDGQ